LLRLAIELDGGYHEKEKVYDEEREKFLSGNFIKTIRFKNEEIENDMKKVLEIIKENFNKELKILK
jgi:very-short-patch-repair endonuclease